MVLDACPSPVEEDGLEDALRFDVDVGESVCGDAPSESGSDCTRFDDPSDDDASGNEVEQELLYWDPNAELEDDSGLVPAYPEGGLVRLQAAPFTLHAMRPWDEPQFVDGKTICGMTMGLSLSMLMAWPATPWPRCRRCF